MLVNRRVFVARAGKGREMTKILVDLFKHNPWPGGSVRIYTSHIGPFGHVVVETESENLATYEEANAQFEQNIPEELFGNFHKLEDSGFHEMWTIAYEYSKG